MSVRESIGFRAPSTGIRRIREAAADPPLVIFSEVHAITADHITRNSTLYPAASLMGSPSEGSGVSSFVYPYPVPIIRDHISSPGGGFFGPETFSCEPYGRVYNCNFVTERSGAGWVRAISAITDPYAISRVLDGRFLTMSIGADTHEVYCSVCTALGARTNMVENGRCEHYRGETYEAAGRQVVCYWEIGPIFAREISFVNSPSDVNARVVTPEIDIHEARTLLAGTDGEFLLDLTTGSHTSSESYRAASLGISRRTYSRIFDRARAARKRYESLGGRRFAKHLTDPAFLAALQSNLKGL